jgi:peptidoglycan hydrolase CwlO-like protein
MGNYLCLSEDNNIHELYSVKDLDTRRNNLQEKIDQLKQRTNSLQKAIDQNKNLIYKLQKELKKINN